MPGIIQCSCLPTLGRFGNQLFMYAHARSYAERHGATLETPPWIGQEVFEGINDPPISELCPRSLHDEAPDGVVDIDLHGYFQRERHLATYTRDQARKWFTFQPRWEKLYNRKEEPPPVVAHLRRGDFTWDFNRNTYCTVSLASYKSHCSKLGIDPDTVMLVTEESPGQTECLPERLHFLPDFMLLRDARILLRGNSTFSWWASTLGEAKTYSPLVTDKLGEATVEFVEGNWPKIHQYADDMRLK